MEIRRDVKVRLAGLGLTSKQLGVLCGIDYGRLTKCLNGFLQFRTEEENRIRQVLNDKENKTQKAS